MATVTPQQLGERIQEQRIRRGFSQSELADLVSLERSVISKLESGQRRVSALELSDIAEALSVRMAAFFEEPTPALVAHRSSQGLDTADSTIDALLADLADEVEFVQSLGALTLPSPEGHWPVPSSRKDAEQLASQVRTQLGVESGAPLLDLPRRFAELGLMVMSRDLGQDVADAGTILLREGGVTLVNSGMKLGRRRLAAAHELGHYLVGDQYTVDYRVSEGRGDVESRLDAFARALLLPAASVRSDWQRHAERSGVRAAAVILASRYRVDMSTLARRLSDLEIADSSEAAQVRGTVTTSTDMIEYDVYLTDDELAGTTQPAVFQRAVLRLVRDQKISPERAVQLLWDLVDQSELPSPTQRDESEIWRFTS